MVAVTLTHLFLRNILLCHLAVDLRRVLSFAPGSCPNLMMSRSDHSDARPVPVALTPQLPPRAHRPLCMSVSSDSSGRFKALETQEWKNNLKAQVCPNTRPRRQQHKPFRLFEVYNSGTFSVFHVDNKISRFIVPLTSRNCPHTEADFYVQGLFKEYSYRVHINR